LCNFYRDGTDRIADYRNNNVFLLKRIMYRKELVGAAYLLGSIYVVVKGSFYVLVHSGHSPYDVTDKIFVAGMDAVDIATSYVDICVYVLDNGNGRVSSIGQNHDVNTTVDGLERGNLVSMSVTKDGRVVIVDNSSKITTYANDGSVGPAFDVLQQGMLHAVEIEAEIFVVGSESTLTKKTKEGTVIGAQKEFGCQHISMDREGNLIVCNGVRQQILHLDAKSLEVMETLLTLDRDGIQNPHHVQYVLENGMMLVSWMNYLDVYSFRQTAAQGYLAPSGDDTRRERTQEAELLERETENSDAFKDLVGLYRRAGMDSIFSDLPPQTQELELPSASSLGKEYVYL